MMRELTGLLGALSILGAVVFAGGGCTPTDRNFASGGTGGAGGMGGSGGSGGMGGGGCPAGFAECDGNPDTVCETDTSSNIDHCGMCNTTCSPVSDGEIGCVAGKCTITSCTMGRDSCDNFYDNGCETNINTDSDHCGVCGNSCEAPNAITGCVAGTCQIGSCVMGKLDCDMDAKTGCEVDPTNNADHCGACGMACSAPNANMGCTNSQCSIVSCVQGFGDCNIEINDGCEAIHSNNPYHCGTCGNVCKNGGCQSGTCIVPQILAKFTFTPGELGIFKDALFVTSRSAGEIQRIDATLGGIPTVVVSSSVGVINAIDVFPNVIFVAGSAGVVRMDWAGANQYSYGTGAGRGIAADLNLVYWTASAAPLAGIRSAPVAGGTSTQFAGTLSTPYGIAVDVDSVYWGLADGTIWTSLKTMPSAKSIGDGPNTADNLALDGTNVYWSSISGIHSMPLGGGTITNLASGTTIRAIAVDTKHVYWTEESSGLIQRVLKDGSGSVEIVAIDQSKPWGLVLTSTTVIWANGGTGEIMKFPK